MTPHLPLATGPFVPGCTDVMLGYSKESPFLRLFYPTEEKLHIQDQSQRWIPWLPDESYLQGLSAVFKIYKIFLKLLLWWSENTKIPAIYGGKPKSTTPLKCIVMSPGLGTSRFVYSMICCELASRGFVVATIEHKDHSACNTYYYANKSDAEKDKRTVLEFEHIKFGKGHYTKRNAQIETRAAECSMVLDFLIQLHHGNVPHNVMDDTPYHKNSKLDFRLECLVGKLDLDKIAIMGHSFGGATALYALSKRPEFKVGVLLDPWMFPVKNEQLEEKVHQPLLFINTQTFHITANVEAMAKIVNGKKSSEMYTIRHTTHENQSDSVLLIGYWMNWFMRKLDPLLALKINNSLILRFLNKHLQYPTEISDCLHLLEKDQDLIEEGLTKPWA